MGEKTIENLTMGYSSAYPTHAERITNYRRIHFAVMAIESGARKLGIPGQVMYDRLKAQDLIHNRLIAMYDDLHTQSIDWVAEDTVTTLKNWEANI